MSSNRPSADEVIWQRPERAGRGPRPTHSRAAVAAAAVRIADAEGLDAVSMRRVAAELGAGTMSLYNYVPKKEHLLDLMLDAVSGEYALPDEPSGDPRADLAMMARQQRAIIARHPWLPRLIAARISVGPNALRCLEFFLHAMAGTSLRGGEKIEAFSSLNGFVNQFAEWEHSQGADAMAGLVGYLGEVIGSGRYPHLAAAMSDDAPQFDVDAAFERSLGRLLTAILLDAR